MTKEDEDFKFDYAQRAEETKGFSTPTPPEEPSGVEEAAEQFCQTYGNSYDAGLCKREFMAGAKWQSTHNILEWPSEEQIKEKFNEWYTTSTHFTDSEESWQAAIQWLKSILNK